MPPFTESRGEPISHGASPPSAPAKPSDLQAMLQDVLTEFVTDSMYDRPEDVLEYMQTWARKHLPKKAASVASSEAVAVAEAAADADADAADADAADADADVARDRKESRLSITPSPATAVTQVTNFTETSAAPDPEVDAEAGARLLRLAAQRQQYLRDVAEGCRDHYLMSLEDSDGDMFHLSALQKKMSEARQKEFNARGDTATVAAQLKAIEESDAPAAQKVQEQVALLQELQQRWATEVPAKRTKP